MEVSIAPLANKAAPGKILYIYNHVKTNQVVYSLSRLLSTSKSLRQLTYAGKKSLPSTIRKDLWTPLATVAFPNSKIGLKTLHLLREFRKLHETAYDKELLGKSLKERKFALWDQRANSIADLAKSIEIQIAEAREAGIAGTEGRWTGKEKDMFREGQLRVMWANLLDSQYAREWPKQVLHDKMVGLEEVKYVAPPVRRWFKERVPLWQMTEEGEFRVDKFGNKMPVYELDENGKWKKDARGKPIIVYEKNEYEKEVEAEEAAKKKLQEEREERRRLRAEAQAQEGVAGKLRKWIKREKPQKEKEEDVV